MLHARWFSGFQKIFYFVLATSAKREMNKSKTQTKSDSTAGGSTPAMNNKGCWQLHFADNEPYIHGRTCVLVTCLRQ